MIEKYLSDSNMRAELLLKFQGKQEGSDTHEGWQDQSTPLWVARDMVALVPDPTAHQWVVLFNHEFLEVLLFERGVPADQIMFMADCYGEGMLSATIYRVKTFILPDDCRDPKRTIELLVPKIEKAFYNGEPMPKTNNLVVVGNPPYQAPAKRKGAIAPAIYQKFVMACREISPRYLSMIIPSRWMTGGQGEGLSDFRRSMLVENGPTKMVDFEDASKIFKGTSIEGGVCYFLVDTNKKEGTPCLYNGVPRDLGAFDIFIREEASAHLLKKINKAREEITLPTLETPLAAQKPYSLPNNHQGSVGGSIPALAKGGNWIMVLPQEVKDRDNVLDTFRVCVRAADGAAVKAGKIIARTFILTPGSACTNTYVILGSFPSEREALNFSSYLLTKFARFLLSLRVSTQTISGDKFAWVPDLGNYTTAPTDEQLFKMFGLSNKEIEYINSRIK